MFYIRSWHIFARPDHGSLKSGSSIGVVQAWAKSDPMPIGPRLRRANDLPISVTPIVAGHRQPGWRHLNTHRINRKAVR
jgi:hypothetical protein